MVATVEGLIQQAGDCGCFQFLVVPLVFSSVPPVVWSMLMMVFGALEPSWSCTPFNTSTDAVATVSFNNPRPDTSAYNIIKNTSVTPSETVFAASAGNTSRVEKTRMYNDNHAVKNCSYHSCDKIVFEPGVNTVVSEFGLVCDLAWVPSLMISLQMVGVLFGASISGQLGDTLGRKKTLLGTAVLHTAFTLVTAFSTSWEMFTVMRVLIGTTVGGILASSFTYPTEFVGVRWRPLLGTIPVWGIGALSYSLVVWALKDWRHVHIATAVCSAATVPAWIFLPESVRWLSVKGHVDQANDVLQKVARWNKKRAPDVTAIRHLCGQSRDSRKTFTYFHIFSSWRMAKIAIVTGYMWHMNMYRFACSLTYYGISFGIKSLSGDFYLNFFLMAVVEIPPSLLVYYLANQLGRRWTCSLAFFITAGSCLGVIPAFFFATEQNVGIIINGLCMVARMSLNLGWNAMTVYIAELYPTVVRNIGIGYCNTTARIGGILAPYILSSGEDELYVFYIVIGVAMSITAVSPLLLRETRGRPLEDQLTDKTKNVAFTVINAYDVDDPVTSNPKIFIEQRN